MGLDMLSAVLYTRTMVAIMYFAILLMIAGLIVPVPVFPIGAALVVLFAAAGVYSLALVVVCAVLSELRNLLFPPEKEPHERKP